MLGKWSVIALTLAAAAIVGCRKTPTAEQRSALATPIALVPKVKQLAERVVLSRAVAAYEWEPTGERAVEVWTAFAAVDEKLAELRRLVAQRSGGARAEAEIERIELQRTREEEMARFAKAQARIEYARAAFNNLAASIDRREGVRAAAGMIARGLGNESSEMKHGLRGLHGRLRVR